LIDRVKRDGGRLADRFAITKKQKTLSFRMPTNNLKS
jgi:hypothetical protein